MTIKTIDGNDYEIEDLNNLHPYSFDTRLIEHIHTLDNTIIRLDTKEQFSGKTKIKTLTDLELKNIIENKPV